MTPARATARRDGDPPTDRRSGVVRWLVILFLVAACLRVGWVVARFGPSSRSERLDYPDEEAYVLSARSLAGGSGLVDEFGYRSTYMPGYPAFLAVFQPLRRPLLWSRLAQAILASWIAPATFLLARRFQHAARPPETGDSAPPLEPLVPVLAGLAAAFDPFLVFFSSLLLTEALFAAVLVSAWLFVLPPARRESWSVKGALARAVPAGLLLLAGVMLRPSAAVLLGAVPLVLLLLRRFEPSAFADGGLMIAVVLLGLLPWAVRNHAVLGEWRWLTTRGGISLYDGLGPSAAGGSDLACTKNLPEVQGLSEAAWDRYFHDEAVREARRDPGRVLRLAGAKFLRTWSLTPNEANYRRGPLAVVSAAWMILLLSLAALGWWKTRSAARSWILLLLPVAAFTLLHMVYVGSVRYRVPEMPFVMVLAAVGAAWAVRRVIRVRPGAASRSWPQV